MQVKYKFYLILNVADGVYKRLSFWYASVVRIGLLETRSALNARHSKIHIKAKLLKIRYFFWF